MSLISKHKDPFAIEKVSCPFCYRWSNQNILNNDLFIPQEKEVDLHVTKYKCLAKGYDSINPQWYFLWHCPHCSYTDIPSIFQGDGSRKIDKFRQRLFAKDYTNNIVMEYLKKQINPKNMDLLSTLCYHLMAIYLKEELLELKDIEVLEMGRLYLRTAWLLREASGICEGTMDDSRMDAEKKKSEKHELLSIHLRSVKKTISEMASDEPKVYNKVAKSIIEQVDSIRLLLKNIQSEKKEGSNQKEVDLDSFFKGLAEIWEEVPCQEEGFLERAAFYYEETSKNQPMDQKQESINQLLFLIADINYRIKAYDKSLLFIDNLLKKNPSTGGSKTKNINQLARSRKETIFEEYYQEHKENIQTVLKGKQNLTSQEKVDLLLSNGISAYLIEELRKIKKI